LRDWIDHGYHEVKAKGGFMGKKWDSFVPQPVFWKECFRVLKPGGYLLSFFGTRTYDWGVMAIRLAGFSVRDQIQWLYGSGMPKSLDISKALDKQAGAARQIISEGTPVKRMIPGSDQDKTGSWIKDNGRTFTPTVTVPTTEAAKQWDGWGTALKPAAEPIVLAQKPMSEKTFAANVLKWGTGGLNINGCRIETDENLNGGRHSENSHGNDTGVYNTGINKPSKEPYTQPEGRWPANVVHDGSPEVMQHFPSEAGASAPVRGTEPSEKTIGIYGEYGRQVAGPFYADTGSAARFFYCAKASSTDRDEGIDESISFEIKTENNIFTDDQLFITWEKVDLNLNPGEIGELKLERAISEGMILQAVGSGLNINLSGSDTMDLFPEAIKFTTLMRSDTIIELKTCEYYQQLSTSDCIADVLKTNQINGLSHAENVTLRNLLILIFIKEKTEFPRGVRLAAKPTQRLINVKDACNRYNDFPTVKPTDLMRWLCRLVTPPGGIVLDPFCGSGSTGKACMYEAFRFVGVDMDQKSIDLSRARIEWAKKQAERLARIPKQGNLFD
jgi:DNA modification methylase